jgi:hypothetical protein
MCPQRRQIFAGAVPLVKETFAEYRRHKGQWLAAAIAYFTMFAIAPLVIIIVEIAGLFLGHHQAVLNALCGYLAQTAGPSASHGIQSIVTASFSQRRAGLIAQAVGWAVFLLAAIGLFTSLQGALNTVWDVTPPKKSIVQAVMGRLFSFGMVLCIAFVLLVSLGLNSVMTIAGTAMSHVVPLFPTLMKSSTSSCRSRSSPSSLRCCSGICRTAGSPGATFGWAPASPRCSSSSVSSPWAGISGEPASRRATAALAALLFSCCGHTIRRRSYCSARSLPMRTQLSSVRCGRRSKCRP